MRIHAITKNRDGCFEHRIALPLAHLGRLGHDTSYGDGAPAALLDELAGSADSVLVGKFITGAGSVQAWEKIASNRRRPALMVYDVDDSYYDVAQVHGGSRSVYADPAVIALSERVMRAADLITTTTPALAERYSHLGTPIAVLPNAVADEVFDWHVKTPPNHFTVGFQGSPSHLQDMQYWLPAFDDFMGRSAARWHWFGMTDAQCFAPGRQKCTAWIDSPEDFHRAMNGKFHAGVAPLQPGVPFNRYKSGLKAQVYAALGRPTVASDIDYYRDVITPGATGILCSSRPAWTEALMYLYENPTEVAAMGMRARELEFGRRMSIVAPLWERAYRKAL